MRNGTVLCCHVKLGIMSYFSEGKHPPSWRERKPGCTVNRGLAKPGINVAPKFYHDMAATHVQYMVQPLDNFSFD
jgi:hypothetical protein